MLPNANRVFAQLVPLISSSLCSFFSKKIVQNNTEPLWKGEIRNIVKRERHNSRTKIRLRDCFRYCRHSLFRHLAGVEKAILAIVFGWLALRGKPAPELKDIAVGANRRDFRLADTNYYPEYNP